MDYSSITKATEEAMRMADEDRKQMIERVGPEHASRVVKFFGDVSMMLANNADISDVLLDEMGHYVKQSKEAMERIGEIIREGNSHE